MLISFSSPEELLQTFQILEAGDGTTKVPPGRERDSSFPRDLHAFEVCGTEGSGIPFGIVREALRFFVESEADTLVSLNEEGDETGEFALYRDSFLQRYGPSLDRDRSRCFPFVVRNGELPLIKEKHVEEAEDYRDRIGDRIVRPERVDPEMRHLIQDDVQRVERVLSLSFGKKVLDAGCSDGTVTMMAAEKWGCEEVIGVDVAQSAVDEALSKARQLSLQEKVRFAVSFIEDLDYPDHYFDTVCATETLEHVALGRFDLSLENLVRVLKPTGNLIVTVPNRYPDSSYVAQKRDRWRWPAHHHFFSRLSLSHILGRFFSRLEFVPHAEGHPPEKGVYLICCCWGKK